MSFNSIAKKDSDWLKMKESSWLGAFVLKPSLMFDIKLLKSLSETFLNFSFKNILSRFSSESFCIVFFKAVSSIWRGTLLKIFMDFNISKRTILTYQKYWENSSDNAHCYQKGNKDVCQQHPLWTTCSNVTSILSWIIVSPPIELLVNVADIEVSSHESIFHVIIIKPIWGVFIFPIRTVNFSITNLLFRH